MSFESEREGLQSAGDAINIAMSRGAFGFNDIELLANAKNGLAKQYNLLEGGLAAIFSSQTAPESEAFRDIPEIKMAIPQPIPENGVKDKNSNKKV